MERGGGGGADKRRKDEGSTFKLEITSTVGSYNYKHMKQRETSTEYRVQSEYAGVSHWFATLGSQELPTVKLSHSHTY